jgi:two-component system, NarL family, sensor kinase
MEGPQIENLLIYILLGSSMMILLVIAFGLFIITYQKRILIEKKRQAEMKLDYQNKMIQMQLDSQEGERQRIGADLHDSLGSLLWAAKVNATFIQRSVILSGETLNSWNELLQILDDGIDTVRRIAWQITPEALHYSGLTESVKKLSQQLNGKGIVIQVEENGNYLWNDQRALQTFRIIQEILSNALKHSKATFILISLNWESENLKVIITDNGTGFDKNKIRKGVGLWNIDQRVKQLDAHFQIGNPPINTGTMAELQVQFNNGK